ncbi:MAG: nucleoside hydrolase [Chloroflexi bacterium]|nr:nucleoside hydrolase [Chloroflexota bacterium]
MQNILIDTDTGVDDAIAIAWLLTQSFYETDIIGISAVAGNTTVDNAANNVMSLLHTLQRTDIPVAVGAAKPFCHPLARANKLIHGPDGLWGAGHSHPYEVNLLPHNVARFYRELVNRHPGSTLLALGPLTNLALAVNQYPDVMRQFGQIVILGGAWSEGSMTPVSDYNFWQDPEAADVVFSSSLPIILMPRDAFIPFTMTFADMQALGEGDTAVLNLLYPPLRRYISIQNQLGGVAAATLPDLVAAMVAADKNLAVSKPATVQIMAGPGPVRGQSVIGFTLQERVSMALNDNDLDRLADNAFSDPDFNLLAEMQIIAARKPANCQVVTDIQVEKMRALFLDTMLKDQAVDERAEHTFASRDLRSEPSLT